MKSMVREVSGLQGYRVVLNLGIINEKLSFSMGGIGPLSDPKKRMLRCAPFIK